MNDVTVIIPTYNRAPLLRQAIRGILAQTRAPDQILIVDDGSTDDTQDVVAPYMPRIEYIRQANRGKATALNKALQRVSSRYVWIFDDDDWPFPDALEQLLSTLCAEPGADFVYSGHVVFHGVEIPQSFDNTRYLPPAHAVNGRLFDAALNSFPFHQNGMLVPLRCYREIGGYNESLLRGQDYDMIIKLCRRYHGVRLDKPTFAFRQHAGLRGAQGQRHAAEERGKHWLHYDRLIFTDIRSSASLEEYADPKLEGSKAPQSMLLMRRGAVMAQHGLLAEALHDVETAISLSDRASCNPLAFQQILLKVAFIGDRPFHGLDSLGFYTRLLWMVSADIDRRSVRTVMRGIYWDVRSRISHRRFRDAATLLVAFVVGGVVAAVRRVAHGGTAKCRTTLRSMRERRKGC